MSERGGKHTERSEPRRRGDENEQQRFTEDGSGERGYRGTAPEDVRSGSVAGGGEQDTGYSRDQDPMDEVETRRTARANDFERGDWIEPAEDSAEWRTGYGAYGVSRAQGHGSNRRSDHELSRQQRAGTMRSGYAQQGFGAGERRGGSWGGGPRGGYGGGEPGGMHTGRGGWSAAEQRHERGRGRRSYGPEGWGAETPWTQSELAGRAEFGAASPGWNREGGYSTAPAAWTPQQRWNIPGPHSGRGPEGYRRSETAIREDVCERLTRHGDIDASRVSVRVEDNEVILEGFVDSRATKRMAEDTAESVSGVKDVHNRLRIEEPS